MSCTQWIVLEVVHFVVEPSATAKADSQGGHVALIIEKLLLQSWRWKRGLAAAPRSPLSKQPVLLWRQRYDDGHHDSGGGSVGAAAAAIVVVVYVG